MKGRRRILLTTVYTCVVAIALGAQAPRACGEEQLPSALRKAIASEFPGWRLVTKADMSADDRVVWNKNHPTWCPGFLSGEFEEAANRGWVVALYRRFNGAFIETMVLMDGPGFARRVVLSAPGSTNRIRIISKAGPGKFYEVETNAPVRLATDSVVYELPESSTILLFVKNGKAHHLQLSE